MKGKRITLCVDAPSFIRVYVHVCIEYIERNRCSVHVYGIAHTEKKRSGDAVLFG